MSRRTWRTRAVFSIWPEAFWKRRLNCSFLSFISSSPSASSVSARTSLGFMPSASDHGSCFTKSGDEARPDRQLGSAEPHRLLRHLARDTVDLEHDPPRLHPRRPEFDTALARAHADFRRLLGHRHIREDPDPYPASTLHVAGHGAPRRLDLPRGHPIRFHRL